MSHHPKILEPRSCSLPTVECQCGWTYTIDPETKANIWYACRRTLEHVPDLDSVFNGYLLGVHAMHVAQLVTNRLDGTKETTWVIQDSRVETTSVPDSGERFMPRYPSQPTAISNFTERIQFLVTLTCRVPPDANAHRAVQAVTQSGQLNLLIPQ